MIKVINMEEPNWWQQTKDCLEAHAQRFEEAEMLNDIYPINGSEFHQETTYFSHVFDSYSWFPYGQIALCHEEHEGACRQDAEFAYESKTMIAVFKAAFIAATALNCAGEFEKLIMGKEVDGRCVTIWHSEPTKEIINLVNIAWSHVGHEREDGLCTTHLFRS